MLILRYLNYFENDAVAREEHGQVEDFDGSFPTQIEGWRKRKNVFYFFRATVSEHIDIMIFYNNDNY